IQWRFLSRYFTGETSSVRTRRERDLMVGFVSVGDVEASGDITTGANIDRSGTQSQAAVDRRARRAIADDSTVVSGARDAAVDAVNDIIGDASILSAGLSLKDLAKRDGWLGLYDPSN